MIIALDGASFEHLKRMEIQVFPYRGQSQPVDQRIQRVLETHVSTDQARDRVHFTAVVRRLQE